MGRIVLLLLLVLALAPAGPADARERHVTARDIVAGCRDPAGAPGGDRPVDCASYMRGLADAISVAAALDRDFEVCIPDTVATAEIAAGFVAFVEENPHYGARWAAPVAVLFLMERYACERVADRVR